MKLRLFLYQLICFTTISGQKTFFGDEPYTWGHNKPYVIPAEYAKYQKADIVILNDSTQFYFYATNNERLVRNLVVKINNENGLEKIQNLKLPESFDQAYDAGLFKQGRQARIKTPFTTEYRVNKLAARKFRRGKWFEVAFKQKYETIRWIMTSFDRAGEFANEDVNNFQLLDLAVGDVIEIHYESAFNSNYGPNLFYFNSSYPKLSCEYDFTYKIAKRFADYAFILPLNIAEAAVTKSAIEQKSDLIKTEQIRLKDLEGINYGINSFEGKTLAHVFADFRFYRIVSNSYPVDGGRLYETELIRPRNFEWMRFVDTANNYTKIYDKQFAAIRKFVATLPKTGSDSTNKIFFKALCDTFNNFRYMSSNHLFYKESNIYEVSSGDHLLKRRLVEHSMWKIYKDILNDNKIFYYTVSVQDKRYGEHSTLVRAHYEYENNLIAIPNKDSYIYFMPRYGGMKYHLNELPFYLEGSIAALLPKNIQDDAKDKIDKFFRFIKTHKGTFNENTRTENGTVKISLDSLKAALVIKESLSGQFSTVLRHLYLNEYIDSTISPYYFKKCTDKPGSSETKIKLSSHITDFPFRYTFNCSEKVAVQNTKMFNLHNWFSFPVSKQVFPEVPAHDYYFDFDFTDSYNFMLDFSSPVEIINIGAFTKKINNDFFELESEIVKNSENSYLLKAKLVVKERKIPLEKVSLITEMVEALETLNNFSLELAKK